MLSLPTYQVMLQLPGDAFISHSPGHATVLVDRFSHFWRKYQVDAFVTHTPSCASFLVARLLHIDVFVSDGGLVMLALLTH